MKLFIKSLLAALVILGISGYTYYYWNNNTSLEKKGGEIVITKSEAELDIFLIDPENNKDPDFVAARKAIETGDIKNAPDLWEKVVKSDESLGKFKNIDSQKPKVTSKILLAFSYIQYGSYYHKEKENAEKTIKILTEDSNNIGAYEMYYIGSAYEISKQYDKALEWYEKGLKVPSNTAYLNSILKNQMGRVYQIQGDQNKAYEYYTQAYMLNKKNYQASASIGRFLAGKGKLKESLPYLEYTLNTKSLPLKAEAYYLLSSIELDLNGLNPDIDKSIEYAQASIKSFPDNYMGYIALARSLYMKNDKKYNKDIEENLEKSIKLNPNNFAAYRYYSLYAFDSGDIEKSSIMMSKSDNLLSKDTVAISDVLKSEKNVNSIFMKSMLAVDTINKSGANDKKNAFDVFLATKYFETFIRLQKKRINNGVIGNYPN